MANIITGKGIYKYNEVALYPGRKLIDKEISKNNLLLFFEVMTFAGIKFSLSFGTLLGAIREKDFIDHDEDIDLIILDEYRNNVLDQLFELRKLGFEVARYDQRGLLSIMKNNEYIDLYFFSEYKEKYRYCSGIIIPRNFLEDLTQIEFIGQKFFVPNDYESFLVFVYGKNWNVPIEYFTPTLKKKTSGYIKIFLKRIMPSKIKKIFKDKSERRYFNKYSNKIKVYENQL